MESLPPLFGVEALHRLHQADVAFGNQVEQRQAVVGVILGDLHDQAQVRLDHVGAGLFVALLDARGEFDLLFRGEQWGLSDLPR